MRFHQFNKPKTQGVPEGKITLDLGPTHNLDEAMVHRSYVGSSEPLWNIRDNNRRLRYRKNEVIIADAKPRLENVPMPARTRDKEYRKKMGGFVGYHYMYIDGKLAQRLPQNVAAGRMLKWAGGKFVYTDTGEPFERADFVHFTPDRGVIAYDVPGSVEISGPNITVSQKQQDIKTQGVAEASISTQVSLPKWQIGLPVFVKHLGQKGKIASLGNDSAIVDVGMRQYRVPLDGLKRYPSRDVAEEQLDEINWKKAAATGAMALGAMGALGSPGSAQARVSPGADGKMSPSAAQQMSQQGFQSSAEKSDRQMPNQNLDSAEKVERDDNGIIVHYDGKEYKGMLVPKDGPTPRGAKMIKITQGQMGERGIGNYTTYLLPNGTAYIYKLASQGANEDVAEASYSGNIGIMELIKFRKMASPDELVKFKKLVDLNKNKLAWKLVQDVVGVKLQGKEFGNNSVAEELDSELDETSLSTMRDYLSRDSDEHTYKVATQKAHYGKESNLNKIEIPKEFKNEWEYQQWVSANKQKSKNTPAMAEETYDDDDEFFEAYGVMWYDEDMLNEAEYQGRKVQLGKPMQGDVKKFKVFVKNEKGNVIKVNFGDKNARIKKSNPARRKSFRARHNCDNPGPRTSARYWSCRKW
jgi:hypothetical protein